MLQVDVVGFSGRVLVTTEHDEGVEWVTVRVVYTDPDDSVRSCQVDRMELADWRRITEGNRYWWLREAVRTAHEDALGDALHALAAGAAEDGT